MIIIKYIAIAYLIYVICKFNIMPHLIMFTVVFFIALMLCIAAELTNPVPWAFGGSIVMLLFAIIEIRSNGGAVTPLEIEFQSLIER